MLDYAKDEGVTREAYASGLLIDKKGRSYIDNLGHLHLRGMDRSGQRVRLFRQVKGICETCGRYRDEDHGDMDHDGKTTKTRCDCLDRRLNNGEVCTGIHWRCTMDVRKGGNAQSCHAKRHNREPRWTPREAEPESDMERDRR